MSLSIMCVEAELGECWLDAAELARMAGVDEAWVRERVAQELLGAPDLAAHGQWRFDARALRRVVRMAALERDFDAVPELAALVADLEEEIAMLRAQLGRVQGVGP